jgi:hypothetical protein
VDRWPICQKKGAALVLLLRMVTANGANPLGIAVVELRPFLL